MQIGDLVRHLGWVGGDYGIITRLVTKTERYAMFEVYWSQEFGRGVYFEDDLEVIEK